MSGPQTQRDQVYGVAGLVIVTLALLGPSLGPLIAGLVRTIVADGLPTPARGLGWTIGTGLGIAILATLLAWVPARVSASGARISRFLPVPVLVPPYLVFAGYGMVRDPSWSLGSMLERLAANGHPWVTRSVGDAMAIAGLALWVFPVAAVVLEAGFRAQGKTIDEMLALDAKRRTFTRLRINASNIFLAIGLVALLTIGSAVPLHLAQIPTMAIDIWRQLGESSVSKWDQIWTSAWPLILLVVAGSIVAAHRLERTILSTEDAHGPTLSETSPRKYLAWVIWMLATVVPFAIFVASIRSAGSLVEFWTLSGPALANAFGYGVADAFIGMMIALAASRAASADGAIVSRIRSWCLIAWVAAAALPGVFIGSALARLGTALPSWSADALVVGAHVARFGVVCVVVGLIAGGSEPKCRRDMRRLEDATRIKGWICACVPWQLPSLVGASVAIGVLGVHEIEATTLVLPPGRANLAQQILGYLHFSRTEELSASSVYIIGSGMLIALFASFLMKKKNRAS